jgi:hypothetical protein
VEGLHRGDQQGLAAGQPVALGPAVAVSSVDGADLAAVLGACSGRPAPVVPCWARRRGGRCRDAGFVPQQRWPCSPASDADLWGGRSPFGYRLVDAGLFRNAVHAGWGRRVRQLAPDRPPRRPSDGIPAPRPVITWPVSPDSRTTTVLRVRPSWTQLGTDTRRDAGLSRYAHPLDRPGLTNRSSTSVVRQTTLRGMNGSLERVVASGRSGWPSPPRPARYMTRRCRCRRSADRSDSAARCSGRVRPWCTAEPVNP